MPLRIKKQVELKKRDLISLLRDAGQDVRGSVLVELLPTSGGMVPRDVSESLVDTDVIALVTWVDVEDVTP